MSFTVLKLEFERKMPDGKPGRITYLQTYNGDILNWPSKKQMSSIKRMWRSAKMKGCKLIAFHLPVTKWKRVPIEL